MKPSARHVSVVASSAIFVAGVFVLIVVVDPFGWLTATPEVRRLQERMAYRKEIAELQYTPIEPSVEPEFERVFAAHAIDPDELISDEQATALSNVIFEQLLARADPDPGAYIALADRDHTRWIEPDDAAQAMNWGNVDAKHKHLFGVPAPKDDVRGVLRRFLTVSYEHDKSLLTGVNVTDRPPFIFYYHIRTSTDIMRRPAEPMDEAAYDDWYNAPVSRGFWFREAERSLEDVIREDGIAKCAAVFVVVETEAGNQYNWETYWYWEPRRARWENYAMARRGWYRHVMYY